MKVLGTHQFQQKRYKLLNLKGEFLPTLGDLERRFIMIIYGESGNGKTEYSIRLAKTLASYGKVAWLSYEQGHGYDLQKAVNRNRINEVSGSFYIIDPNEGNHTGKTYLDELVEYLDKRNSPDFIFIDSVDYTGFTFDDYKFLKLRFKCKAFIFISHADAKKPRSSTGKRIKYDGHIGVRVDKYIAYTDKNRFGGIGEYLIWEQMARELNPGYFLARLKAQNNGKQGVLSVENTAETTEKMHIPPLETMGVHAKSTELNPSKKADKTPVAV